MEKLTKKERIELEQVFAVIYTKKPSKFILFYRYFWGAFSIKKRSKKQRQAELASE